MEIIISIPKEVFYDVKLEGLLCYDTINLARQVTQAFQNSIPVLKGEWVYREELFDDEDKPRMAYGCSICGHSIKSTHEKRNYCPNCGAKMVKPQESEDNG